MKRGKIGIIGCGWLGYRIANHLKSRFEIHTTVRTRNKIRLLEIDGFHPELIDFDSTDAEAYRAPWRKSDLFDHLIITVPLFSKRTDAAILNKRIANLSSFIAPFKGTLILMSSIGVYGEGAGEITEQQLSPENCAGEKEIRQVFSQSTILRLAGLMGDDRLLHKYKVADLDKKVNHVHYHDICSVVQLLVEDGVRGAVYNVVAPLHPSKREVIDAQMGRITTPSPAEAGGKIVLTQKIIDELGYRYVYPDPASFHLPIHTIS